MDDWLDFAQGPFFRFTFAVMVLGLLRNLIIMLWSVREARRMTRHRRVSWRRVASESLDWLLPVRHLRPRVWGTTMSIVFHAGVILTPLLLAAHVQRVALYLGIAWPTLPAHLADAFTLLTLAALTALVLFRLASRSSRILSRFQDFALPAVLLLPFASGFLASHPHLNPFPYGPTLLVHALSAGVCFLLVPFTKLSHMMLAPLAHLPSELAWRFPPDYPEAVARQIGKEGQPI